MAKTVEVTEAELLENRQAKATLEAMMKHPAARKKVLEAWKTVKPDEVIPELDAAQPVLAEVDKVRQEFADFKKSMEDERAKETDEQRKAALEARWKSGQDSLRAEHRYTDEGIKAVEELMQKHNIIDHDVGRKLFEAEHPPQQPLTPSGSGPWNFFEMPADTSDDLKKLMETKGKNESISDKMARDVLAETRGQSRR